MITMSIAAKRHPNSKRWLQSAWGRKQHFSLSGSAAEQRWMNSRTQGSQAPAVLVRPVVYQVSDPWWRSANAVTDNRL